MSKENTETKGSELSPFQQFVKENATGPEGSEPAAEPAAEEAPAAAVAEPKTDATPEPTSIQDLVRQKQAEPDLGPGETHEYFTDLAKPGKGASRSEQINYVKEVGNRYKKETEDLKAKLAEQEGKTFDPKETDEWKEFAAEADKYKSQAEKAKELEEKLAAVDLQYDPVFKRELTEPIGKEENSLLEIVKVSKGEDAGAMVPLLQAAVAAGTEAEFLQSTRDIVSELEPHFAHAAFEHLRNIRGLYAKRNDYLANHQETSKKFQTERAAQNKAQSSKFLKADWKKYRETAEGSVSSTWDLLESLGNESMSSDAKKAKNNGIKWAEAGIQETLDQYGGVSESVAQTVALAPELLALIPLVDSAMEYIKTQNEEHSKIKREYEKLTQSKPSTTSRPNRSTETPGSDAPESLVAFARQQGVLS